MCDNENAEDAKVQRQIFLVQIILGIFIGVLGNLLVTSFFYAFNLSETSWPFILLGCSIVLLILAGIFACYFYIRNSKR